MFIDIKTDERAVFKTVRRSGIDEMAVPKERIPVKERHEVPVACECIEMFA